MMTEVEIRQIEPYLKAAFVRGADCASVYHVNGAPLDMIEEGFKVWIKEMIEAAEVER